MDDLRENLRDDLHGALPQFFSGSAVEDVLEYLLAAGWTKPPVAQEVEPAAHSDADISDCDWPSGKPFTFLDEQGEHDPCYVAMPDGGCLVFSHHAAPNVDIARAKWVINACNAALSTQQPPSEAAPYLRPEVLAFAHLMEAQLKANDHKPGWKKRPPRRSIDAII